MALSLYFARNFSESDLLDPVGLSWILALFAALMTGIRPLPARRAAAAGTGGSLERVRA
jgi:hypothetical protein